MPSQRSQIASLFFSFAVRPQQVGRVKIEKRGKYKAESFSLSRRFPDKLRETGKAKLSMDIYKLNLDKDIGRGSKDSGAVKSGPGQQIMQSASSETRQGDKLRDKLVFPSSTLPPNNARSGACLLGDYPLCPGGKFNKHFAKCRASHAPIVRGKLSCCSLQSRDSPALHFPIQKLALN